MQTQLWWVGVDGSVWDLLSGAEGMTALDGLKGLKLPTFKDLSTVSARQEGQTHRGTRWDPRMVVFKYLVQDVVGDGVYQGDWRVLDRAVEASMSTEDVAWLMIVSDSGYRTLKVRMAGGPTELTLSDPARIGSQTYSVDLVADQPWYEGFQQVKAFTGLAALASASIGNPGTREVWPIFTVAGPGTYTLGCDPARLTTLPPLVTGQVAVYDTDPGNPTLVDGTGVSLWPQLTLPPRRAPLPKGSARPLYLSYTGAGTPEVDVSFVPRFGGPW